jgi:hypothetical protein
MCLYNHLLVLYEETKFQLFHDISSQPMFHMVGTATILYSYQLLLRYHFLFLYASLNFHIYARSGYKITGLRALYRGNL